MERHPRDVELPRVNPVGVVEVPAGYRRRPGRHGARLRLAAMAILGVFLASSVGTTVYSLGVHCITSFAGPSPFGSP